MSFPVDVVTTKTFDRGGLEVLDWDDCFSLARTQAIGRLSVTRHALPIIIPVAFAMLDDSPVFKVGPGAIHRAATHGAVCCFEVDSASPDWTSAWSVMMIGRLAIIDDPVAMARAARLGLPSWPGHTDTGPAYVRFVPQVVTGRRLGGPVDFLQSDRPVEGPI